MNNEGLMIFIIQAILALFAFFVVAPCVLNAVSLFTVQKRFARTMIDLGVVQADVVHKLHPKKEIAGVSGGIRQPCVLVRIMYLKDE